MYHSDEQEKAAKAFLKAKVEQSPAPILTQIKMIDKFHAADTCDQDFYRKNPDN